MLEETRERERGRGGDPSTAHKHAALPKPNPSLIYFVNLTLTQHYPLEEENPPPTYPFLFAPLPNSQQHHQDRDH